MLHDPEAEVAANAVEDDPRTVAEETIDAKVAGTETIEAATEETVAADVPPTEDSETVAATAGSEAETEEQVAMASAVDEALNAVDRQTEASVAPKGSAQVPHTPDPPEISEHLVRLNARKIEWTWFHECRIALPQCA